MLGVVAPSGWAILPGMSEGNMAVFARIVEAVNRGDAEAACQLTAEDAVVIPRRAATEGAYVGHDGVQSWFADNEATFEVFRLDYQDVRDLGDRVLAIGTVHIRGRGSQVETDVPSAGIATFGEGKATRWEDFGDARLAVEAARLAAG
jgi:ketosteroid isomerase-like protein